MKYERIEKAVFLEQEKTGLLLMWSWKEKRKSSCEKYRPV